MGKSAGPSFFPFALQRYDIKVPKVKSLHVCVSFASCICFEVCVHMHPRTVSVVFASPFRTVFNVFTSRVGVFSSLFRALRTKKWVKLCYFHVLLITLRCKMSKKRVVEGASM